MSTVLWHCVFMQLAFGAGETPHTVGLRLRWVRPGGQLTPPKQEENRMRKIMGEDKDREIAY